MRPAGGRVHESFTLQFRLLTWSNRFQDNSEGFNQATKTPMAVLSDNDAGFLSETSGWVCVYLAIGVRVR